MLLFCSWLHLKFEVLSGHLSLLNYLFLIKLCFSLLFGVFLLSCSQILSFIRLCKFIDTLFSPEILKTFGFLVILILIGLHFFEMSLTFEFFFLYLILLKDHIISLHLFLEIMLLVFNSLLILKILTVLLRIELVTLLIEKFDLLFFLQLLLNLQFFLYFVLLFVIPLQ